MYKITSVALLLLIGSNSLVQSAVIIENADDELIGVAVYFRHGDRTPKESFPTDEFFKMENFPMGLGQLTNRGINRHYELGQWFRQRYGSFLPEAYAPTDVLVKSTDVDRTLMSATANLAGLYPPEGDLVWNTKLPWRPIPVHTTPQEEDAVLAMKKECPRQDKLYKKQKKAEFYQEINKRYADLYEYVAKYSGLEVEDIKQIKLIRSVFYCYKSLNASYIPAWADELNQTDLDYLAGLAYGRHSVTEEMKMLRAGPFFDYLLNDYFTNVAGNVPDTPKFVMFSSHDSNLASVLDAMGVFEPHPPSFAATIIWEMRRSEMGKEYVNLLYRKNEDELLPLVVPGCTADCDFELFKNILEPVTVTLKKWKKACGVSSDDDE